MAYFTDPMGDEFKKAMEEAMKEMEEEEAKVKPIKKKRTPSRSKKRKRSQDNRFSATEKRSLR